MGVELLHDGPHKFALAGIDLNVPIDLVPESKYAKAVNIVSKIEGQLQTRDGVTLITNIAPAIPIHTIFRLTQSNPSVIGERLVGWSSFLYTAPLPAGNVFTQLTGGPSFDGLPLSIIQFRFDSDPAVWAIIANANGMMKRRAGYYEVLGVAPPSVAATASAGGAGLLNSSTGVGYDWRYTYLNEVTQSESNGSPITASPDVHRPVSNQTPDATLGGVAYATPTLAYDNNFATAAIATTGITNVHSSIRIFGWPAATFTYSALTLYMNMTWVGVSFPFNPTVSAEYSTDGGVTWSSIMSSTTGSVPNTTYSVNLPPGQDMTKLQVRAQTTGHSFTHSIFEVWTSGVTVPPNPSLLSLTNQSAKVCVVAPIDPQETAIKLYRRGGTLPNNWFFVIQAPVSSLVQGTCGAGTLEIDDNVPDSTAEIGAILPQDNFQPIQSVQAVNFPLPVIFGPSDGRVLACGDPARPDAVYFSNKGNADLWGAEAWVVVANPGEQMMNGIVYALRTFAFSRERMYIMLPNIITGITFTPAETSCRRGLKGRWALTAGEQGVYFVSKDGVYRTQGGPEQSIIDDSIRPLFPTREAPQGTPTNGVDAVDMTAEDDLRLTFHNSEIWFYYKGLTTGDTQLLIYDERHSRWRQGSYIPKMKMAYSEPNTTSSLLYGGTDGSLYSAGGSDDSGQGITVDILTGAMDQGRPLNLKEYLTVNFDIDPGGATSLLPVRIIPSINGNQIIEAQLLVTGSGRQRVTLPLNQSGAEVYAYNIAFNVLWAANVNISPVLYQYEILHRHEPAELTHWELPQTGMGMEGWFHMRDLYVVLRSTAPVTLTITPGLPATGGAQTFTLPSTGGLKNTLYVQLAMNKANSYEFRMDSAASFRVYAEECECRIKQWLTNLGYKNVPIIGREQIGRPFGLTNV